MSDKLRNQQVEQRVARTMQNDLESRIHEQVTVLAAAIDKILSLRNMTSAPQAK